jgi:hypothetical protein
VTGKLLCIGGRTSKGTSFSGGEEDSLQDNGGPLRGSEGERAAEVVADVIDAEGAGGDTEKMERGESVRRAIFTGERSGGDKSSEVRRVVDITLLFAVVGELSEVFMTCKRRGWAVGDWRCAHTLSCDELSRADVDLEYSFSRVTTRSLSSIFCGSRKKTRFAGVFLFRFHDPPLSL